MILYQRVFFKELHEFSILHFWYNVDELEDHAESKDLFPMSDMRLYEPEMARKVSGLRGLEQLC